MKLIKLYLLIISTITLISCSERDGEADAMEWTTNVSQMNDGCIEVPQSGNSYIFECTNYDSYWLTAITLNGKGIELDQYVRDEYQNEWLTVKIDKNILSVDILSNESSENRSAFVVVRAGNMTDGFTFNQK
ncbi:MAG: BACON domain-containing carbohydrate-binding protein [Rikenellaceae bacterium]